MHRITLLGLALCVLVISMGAGAQGKGDFCCIPITSLKYFRSDEPSPSLTDD